ncbi:cation diffusion facilitator family transporter [bacterium]|nr:MAG: cation diffusion facilitator family transporter [bacterium]RIK61663.1 MAG: cobalt transporter [Planctomycetota bacterium]
MADSGSKGAVLAAVCVNVIITILKFVAFAISGSGSMFSEAMHTLADAGNQFLLYLGIRRSERPADAMFHYGYGYERFLFALLSAAGIFVLGCGVTVYHGIDGLIEGHKPRPGWFDFVVLGIGFVLDGWILYKAINVVRRQKGSKGFFEYLRTTSDPTVLAVLFEDCVACLGVLLALGGIGLSVAFNSGVPDAIGSILIGILLGVVAVWLGFKNRALILGISIPRDVELKIVDWLKSQPSIEAVHSVQSRVLGSEQFKFKAEVDFNGRYMAEKLKDWLENEPVVKTGASDQTPEQRLEFAKIFGEKLMQAQGEEINRIESEMRQAFPQLQFIDLEAH